MKLGRLVWLVAGSGMALAGCFYVDPINRRPRIMPLLRQCDPTVPCSLNDLHHGDSVRLKAVFNDPDGDESKSSLQWRISACDGTGTQCDLNRLYEGGDTVPSFVVRDTLEDASGPVLSVVVDLDVFDERGASSSSETALSVIPDGPTLALRRAAGTRAVGDGASPGRVRSWE